MRRIVYGRPGYDTLQFAEPRRDDQRIEVYPGVPGRDAITREMTIKELETRAWSLLPKDAINPRWIEESELPPKDIYRDAYVDDGEKLAPDLSKAQEIHADMLQRHAKSVIVALNEQFIHALQTNGDTKAIVSEKLALLAAINDPEISKAKTLEELKAIMPEALKQKVTP